MSDDLYAGDKLLSAWLGLTSTLWNRRIVSAMPYNEAHVLGLLLRSREMGTGPMTATDLIRRTHLLKSQMNRLLSALEEKGYIHRIRSEADKRMAFIHLTPEGEAAYRVAHADVEAILAKLLDRIGEKRALAVAEQINDIVAALENIFRQEA